MTPANDGLDTDCGRRCATLGDLDDDNDTRG